MVAAAGLTLVALRYGGKHAQENGRLFLLNLALLVTTVAASSPANEKPHSPARAPAAYECLEEKLGVIPDESRVSGNPLVDYHGWRYGLALGTPGGKRLWLDGKLGPEFEDLVDAKVTDVGLQYDFAFSPDGKHLAYGARRTG